MNQQSVVKTQKPTRSGGATSDSLRSKSMDHPDLTLEPRHTWDGINPSGRLGNRIDHRKDESYFKHDARSIPITSSQTGTIQTKLTISQPGDRHEQEADRVADQVMRMPDSKHVQRECTECEDKESVQIRREPGTAGPAKSQGINRGVESQIQSLRGGGQPLPESSRAFFEPRFGRDFSNVRVHTDDQAVQAARGVNARAFAVGQDIAFDAGAYSPGSSDGRRLLAHELTHTIQQDNGSEGIQRDPNEPIVKSGGGGYKYQQHSDGKIVILEAPGGKGVGTSLPPGNKFNKRITAEIGPYTGKKEAEPAPSKGTETATGTETSTETETPTGTEIPKGTKTATEAETATGEEKEKEPSPLEELDKKLKEVWPWDSDILSILRTLNRTEKYRVLEGYREKMVNELSNASMFEAVQILGADCDTSKKWLRAKGAKVNWIVFGTNYAESISTCNLDQDLKIRVLALFECLVALGFVKAEEFAATQACRSRAKSHRLSTAYHIHSGRVSVAELQAHLPPEGKGDKVLDVDENGDEYVWYERVWTEKETKEQAVKNWRGGNIVLAYEGFQVGDARRKPNSMDPKMPIISEHVFGRAMDVRADTVWKVDPWHPAINALIKSNGLMRPVDKTSPYGPEAAEHWHFEKIR